MIVVDTNVLSETLRAQPAPQVLSWLDDHRAELAVTAVTVAELLYSVRRLPHGRRREALSAAVEALVSNASRQVLGFGRPAARAYARIRADREARGHVVAVEDTMIAAICAAEGHAVATRNVRDFGHAGLTVIDPWTET